ELYDMLSARRRRYFTAASVYADGSSGTAGEAGG
ncbi:hypothetical protein LTSEJOH_0367, partial [Salmonella enterica subsp. enterica serovar Johannesburg str. S5-703]